MAESSSEVNFSGLVLYSREEKNPDVDEIWDDSALIDAYDKAVRKAKSMIKERQKNNSTSGSVGGSSSAGDAPKLSRNRGRHKGNPKEKSSKYKIKWQVGDRCRALYSDGLLYEADVLSVNPEVGSCDVQFYGYGNSESVLTKDIYQSLGEQARQFQLSQAQLAVKENEQKNHKRHRSPYRHNKNDETSKGSNSSTTNKWPHGCHEKFPSSHYMPSEPVSEAHSHHQRFSQPSNLPSWIPSCLTNASSMIPPPPPHPPFDNMEEDEDALSSMLMAWYMSGYHTGYYQGLRCGRRRMTESCAHGSGCGGQANNCSHSKFHH